MKKFITVFKGFLLATYFSILEYLESLDYLDCVLGFSLVTSFTSSDFFSSNLVLIYESINENLSKGVFIG
jgi:hypothetical protein